MVNFSDTICAPATSVGTGAISVVRISGSGTTDILDRVVRFRNGTAAAAPGYSVKYGSIPDLDEYCKPADRISVSDCHINWTGDDE